MKKKKKKNEQRSGYPHYLLIRDSKYFRSSTELDVLGFIII